MANESYPRLLGDIGGTNARFAWQTDSAAPPTEGATYACAEHASLLAAIRHYLAEHRKQPPSACATGIANPILGDRVQMTNHHWSFSMSALQQDLGLKRLKVVNDFTALALSLPTLQPADLRRIGHDGVAVPGAAWAVLGPGTGLGVSGLLPSGTGGFVPVSGGGGHVTLADQAPLPLGPAGVIERARDDADPSCAAAIDLFCKFLGGVAGDLALTLGARGGSPSALAWRPGCTPRSNARRCVNASPPRAASVSTWKRSRPSSSVRRCHRHSSAPLARSTGPIESPTLSHRP